MTRVNLGAGLQSYEHPGYVSVDRIKSDGIDIVWDCEMGLPKRTWERENPLDPHSSLVSVPEYKVFPDNTVDEFLCKHFLEHIRNLIPLMDEMWSALRPNGILHIFVPNAHHIKAAWSDPTHVRAFTLETFDYFTHETLAAYPYTKKEWKILDRGLNGMSPDDLWEIEVVMQPVK